MVGFTEGCFSIRITKSSTTKTGFQVQLRFNITQKILMVIFEVNLRFRENKVDFQILKMKDLCDKVIPFFQNMPI